MIKTTSNLLVRVDSNGTKVRNFLMYRKPPACGICDDSFCVVSATKSQAGCLCYPKNINLVPSGGAPGVKGLLTGLSIIGGVLYDC